MSPATYAWVKSGHLIGVFLWLGGLFSVYWLLRLHASAPKDMRERFTLLERSLALMTDIAAALAIGCGIAMIFGQTPNFLVQPHHGWFHIKLAVVVVGVLSVHGVVRAKVGKFGRGQISPVPAWAWTLLLASVMVILILVYRVRFAMEFAPAEQHSSAAVIAAPPAG
ncbi:MAG: hypothetical protein E6J90_50285 [Deltaproteobacteria bacterium]|nr:MAG: hypothetical protein E6J90_50285 [Deltaproteobacteria bacterium]TMQ10678.1 MAG: hypothetical protein E6J91_25640 [Deltaproteobacteria bacterium]